ncbi:Double-stranded RNA-binding protein 1 [Morella rubra]|uniref:Double-stranded RNA-binding protein 1 n=1 Tax=Morella rubra TaxID=262757 RepID=A0A6A1WNL2_9ROSI|nr:Double-stranded RNA-binding protein 1 [Morella rubra]KAB1226875.1 Double-stranded RNA-binding protein 1 [Morella rubra]
MYKTKLQELCHKKQWGSPQYSTMKDGPDHDPSFKASVSVNGHLFHSPVLFKSSKAAQNDSAKLAFQHYFPSCNAYVQQLTLVLLDLQGQYKSRLNDYSQWKYLDPPSYTSKTAGPSHAIHFKATVTVGGHAFESPEFFKTLKEAEHAAAKAALMSLPLDGFQKAGRLWPVQESPEGVGSAGRFLHTKI